MLETFNWKELWQAARIETCVDENKKKRLSTTFTSAVGRNETFKHTLINISLHDLRLCPK